MMKNGRNVIVAAATLMAWTVLAGVRPYEFEWASRTKDDRPVLLPLVSVDGWQCSASNFEASVSTANERVLFGDGVMRLEYRIPHGRGVVRLKPSAPVSVSPGADTVSLWLWGNHIYYGYRNVKFTDRLWMAADFLDSDGKPFSVRIHTLNHNGWFLVQKRFSPDIIARIANGGKFTGFTLGGGKETARRWIEFTSLAVYKEELKPLSFRPRPKRGVQVFPNAPQGLNTGEGRLPFPNVATTIVPIVPEDPDIEFRIPDNTLDWDNLAVRYRKGRWLRFALGGGLFPVAAANGAKIRFHRIANSLVADIEAPAGVEEVRFGGLADYSDAQLVQVPYYTFGVFGWDEHKRPNVVMTKEGETPFFFLSSFDWTQSNASQGFYAEKTKGRPLASNGGVKYFGKTDGVRNPVFERFVWSFSGKVEDVLPSIPNPPSPYREATAERQWTVWNSGDRDKDRDIWRMRYRYGFRYLCVNDHEMCMRDANESFTFRTCTAPGKGGDEGMHGFTRFMIDELGYRYGPYNNYTDFAPINGWWSADRVTRDRQNDLVHAWNRCYAPKPAWINEACEVILSELQRKFRFNTAYCDVHTCACPWRRTDYDARIPGAGTFVATFYSFGELLGIQRRVIGGPIYSEGGCHFMYCGLVDGSYAQDQHARLCERPWLVDFDLRRLHPLCNNFGMGDPKMFCPEYYTSTNPVAMRDRFLAATVAFGHQGYFIKGGREFTKRNREIEEQSYFMMLGTARHYCKADAKEIGYADADGKLHGTTDAVASGIYRRSQVAVRYTDGTMTAANGSTNETMDVELRGHRFTLSPNGYCAIAGDGTAAVVSGAVRNDGSRLDISVAPDYVYLNAYGKRGDSPFGGTDGRMYRLIEPDGTDEVFLSEGTTFSLPYAAVSVTALSETGKEIGPVPFTTDGCRTRLSNVKGAVSYRVKKPSVWREAHADVVFAGFEEKKER